MILVQPSMFKNNLDDKVFSSCSSFWAHDWRKVVGSVESAKSVKAVLVGMVFANNVKWCTHYFPL